MEVKEIKEEMKNLEVKEVNEVKEVKDNSLASDGFGGYMGVQGIVLYSRIPVFLSSPSKAEVSSFNFERSDNFFNFFNSKRKTKHEIY